ncbi:MAG TPA: SIR2 family protein [Vicinamibacterales bacterium]|nr:SIR2 family protein [Vicinamibacterales bacterium]
MDLILFGAGASKDAGLPDTFELTDIIMERVQSFDSETAKTLNFIAGALLFHGAANGQNPLSGRLDAEELFRAVTVLETRDQAELAAFVTSFHPQIARLKARSNSAGENFPWVRRQLLALIAEALWKPQVQFGYLAPLAELVERQGRLTIATLNYDTIVEQFCRSREIPFSTGLPQSSGYDMNAGYGLSFGDPGVDLLKLHGSLSWTFHETPSADDTMPQRFVLPWGEHRPEFDMEGRPTSAAPALLFGGPNKLTADGPFLELFMRFRQELRAASRLIIVGYSFRDDHVNSEITAFVNRSPRRTVVVVDPAPPLSARFVEYLQRTCGPKLVLVQRKAKDGLAEALKPGV